MLLRFISDQKNFLQQTVKNISDVTNAVKPPTKEDIFKKADSFLDYNSVFSKLFFIWPQKEVAKSEPYDEIVESLKVKLNQMLDEVPQNMKDELKDILNIKKQNFFINTNSHCKSGASNDATYEENIIKPEECNQQCNNKTFIIDGKSSLTYS